MTSPIPDFGEFVARFEAAVCATAYAVVRDRGRSEEIAQEAFIVAWQKLPAMKPTPALPGWVCGIARNLARNAARRRKEMPMDASTPELATETTALDAMIDREKIELANRALEQLSEVEREAIVVYYRGDESLGSVARALGISEAAAKKRVLRGRDHLRAALADNAAAPTNETGKAGLGDIEASLRATKPSAAFRTGCVVAATAAGLALHDRVAGAAVMRGADVPTPKSVPAWLLATVIAVPVIAGGAFVAANIIAPSHEDSANREVVTAAASSRSARATSSVIRHVDPDRKQQLVAQISAARTARRAPVLPPHDRDRAFDFSGSPLMEALPEPAPRAPGPLDKTALRAAIRSVQPLIRECYDKLGNHATGSLDLVVHLESEADIGTIATDARVDGVFAANTELVECVRESLLSIEMPDLVDPGVVDVYYPFTI